MKRKCFKYIFIIMIGVFISFLNINELYASDFCEGGPDRLYCEYELAHKVSVIYKIQDSKLTVEVKSPEDSSFFRYVFIQDFTINSFYFSNRSIKYACHEKIGYHQFQQTISGVTTYGNEIYKERQDGPKWYQFKANWPFSDLKDNCTSMGKESEILSKTCGNYGGIELEATKNDMGGFDYIGIYSGENFHVDGLKPPENFSIENSIINPDDGCPDKICFIQKNNIFKSSNELKDCRGSTSATTGNDIESAQDIQLSSFFDKWDKIPALLNGISEIKSGKLSCGSIGKVIVFMQKIFNLIKVAAFLLLIVFTAIDFTKAVSVSDDDAMKKALNKFVKRSVITVIIVLLPSLINLILGLVAISGGTCGIS